MSEFRDVRYVLGSVDEIQATLLQGDPKLDEEDANLFAGGQEPTPLFYTCRYHMITRT